MRTIYTVQNAIICSSAFSLKEAHTAAAAGDDKWLAQLDCGKAAAGMAAIVIDAFIPLGYFKVRLIRSDGQGMTGYGSLSDFVEPKKPGSGKKVP